MDGRGAWPARLAGLVLAVVALAVPLGPAWAADWGLDAERSSLAIRATQGTEAFEGRFQRFTADIRFDPANLDQCRVVVTIDPTSLDTGSRDRDEIVPSAPWFDASRFPVARFEATRFTALGGDRYEAQGTLSIKGMTRTVTLPFTLAIAGDTAEMRGELTLDRTDYGLGEGDFADPSLVGHDVAVIVTVTAHRVP